MEVTQSVIVKAISNSNSSYLATYYGNTHWEGRYCSYGLHKKISFIKIINDTHLAFLQHNFSKGKDSSAAVFVAGGGSYSLNDNLYTEHLEYCSAREREGNDFSFQIDIKNDTLIQSGVEKAESAGVNRINIEKYIKMKK